MKANRSVTLWAAAIVPAAVSIPLSGCDHASKPANNGLDSAMAEKGGDNPVFVESVGPSGLSDKDGLDVLSTLPPFELTAEDGNSFGSEHLRGKVWIATFIFTRCSYTCPAQMAEFRRIQEQLSGHPARDDIHLVSITVDPKYDTPEVLQAYADKSSANPTRWKFLTGRRSDLWSLSKDGFKLSVFDSEENSDALIAHSQKFVLVDRHGRIRGYYEGLEAAGREKLMQDLEILLAND